MNDSKLDAFVNELKNIINEENLQELCDLDDVKKEIENYEINKENKDFNNE